MQGSKGLSLLLAVIILLLMGMGGLSIYFLKSISLDVETFYQRAFVVSRVSRDIKTDFVQMHREMKKIVMSSSVEKITETNNQVDKYETRTLKNFSILFAMHSEKSGMDLQLTFADFNGWKQIRDEIVLYKVQGKDEQAKRVLSGRSAQHLAILSEELQRLIDIADQDALNFIQKTTKTKNGAIAGISLLLLLTVFACSFTSYYFIRRFNAAHKNTKSRMHLIDQNILMATYNEKGIVLDISNKLCRYLGMNKEQKVGKQGDFLLTEDSLPLTPNCILTLVKTGKRWQGEICRRDHYGEIKWINSTIYPELNSDYKVIGYSNIFYDITDKKRVEALSITDNLTQLHNRRHFDELLIRETKLARRNNSILVLAIIDVDYFKRFNDCYGHPQGDKVLTLVANTLSQMLGRANDYAFRLGGEEFALLFSSDDESNVEGFIDKIRVSIESLQLKHEQNDVSEYITVSIGAQVVSGKNVPTPEQFYINADKALYKAKKSRNSVVLF